MMQNSATTSSGAWKVRVVEKVLRGLEKQDFSDDELLQRGIDLVEGLYASMN